MTSLVLFNTFQQIFVSLTSFEFLLVGFLVILVSFFGVALMDQNVIIVFMCLELVFVSVAFICVTVSFFFAGSSGLIFGYLVLIVAGAESALALSMLTCFFFVEQSIEIEFFSKLKG